MNISRIFVNVRYTTGQFAGKEVSSGYSMSCFSEECVSLRAWIATSPTVQIGRCEAVITGISKIKRI